MKAKSYSALYKQLYTLHPLYYTKFLSRAIKAVQHQHEKPRGASRAKRIFFVEPDTGPENAWRWAHNSFSTVSLGQTDGDYHQVREWGYVMWDQVRLNEGDIFNKPLPEREDDSKKEAEEQEEMCKSWKRRSFIHLAGGRGWWSWEDESKVLWPKGAPSPLDDEVKRKECTTCFGSVICAPHRLVLKIPKKEESES